MRRALLTALMLAAFAVAGYTQETSPADSGIVTEAGTGRSDWLSAGGYASWLHMAMFRKPSEEWANTSMLHNRLNFSAYAGNSLTFALEVRNRFVTGDMVTLDPAYASGLSADPGWADLSWNISDGSSCVLNMMVDRAYIDFTAGRLQLRAGRQRINWSQALIWNPNDIFNTYSFFDFDYVERPGSDALRLTYSTGPASSVEAAVKADNRGRVTAAALGRFSVLNTDLQILAGVTDNEYFTAGTGWSGAVGSVSVRGEATLFAPFDGAGGEKSNLTATIGADKAFSDKVTALVQVMYSNNPVNLNGFTDLYGGGLTARQLAFSEFSAAGQVSYTPVPLVNISVSAIWFPDLEGFYAGPSLDVSLAENVDFTLLWQHFRSTFDNEETRINLAFLRIRYSF
ncbi:MAG: hypothetical protein QUS66_00020 [Bacteroidota bacterium]|nr:hypothetical protein [Bacteroidota bacterium]